MPEGRAALWELRSALGLGAMPNPNKEDQFDQWPLYALCEGHFILYVTMPSRLSLLPAIPLGDGFTHNLAGSLPERHNVAGSRVRA